MKITNNMKELNYNGFRVPTQNEATQIAKYYQVFLKKSASVYSRLSTVMCVLGTVMCFSLNTSSNLQMIICICVAAMCFVLAFCCIKAKNNMRHAIDNYYACGFVVADGIAKEVKYSTDSLGKVSVWFESEDSVRSEGWYEVPNVDIQVGSQLLLVYSNTSDIKYKFAKKVFTQYMLTDEGITTQWSGKRKK